MKIRVIGSGSMWTLYNSASYMIDDNILVDMPNGMCKYLFRMNINPREIVNVLLTHFHGDHYFDMPFYFLLKSRADNKNINVYCSKEGKRKTQKLLKLAFPNSARGVNDAINLNYIYDDCFKVNDYKVRKILVDHGRMKPAYGYIFETDNNKIGFTGDSALCSSVEYMASVCDYLFCDCMFIEGTSKHMGIDNIKKLSKNNPNCKFVVSHLEDETRDKLKEEKIKNVIVPDDDYTIII